MALIFVLIPETKAGELGQEPQVDINIIHDSYAETQTYETFFMVFTEELLRFKKENRGKISGQLKILCGLSMKKDARSTRQISFPGEIPGFLFL